MADFVVPPSNYEVKMKDGTRYLPSKSGTIHVENRRHADEIRNSKAKNRLDMIKEKTQMSSMDTGPDNTCGKCLFAAHAFQTDCPRCGNDLPRKVKG